MSVNVTGHPRTPTPTTLAKSIHDSQSAINVTCPFLAFIKSLNPWTLWIYIHFEIMEHLFFLWYPISLMWFPSGYPIPNCSICYHDVHSVTLWIVTEWTVTEWSNWCLNNNPTKHRTQMIIDFSLTWSKHSHTSKLMFSEIIFMIITK